MPVAGPLRRVVAEATSGLNRAGTNLGIGANGLIVLRRLAFADEQGNVDERPGHKALLWAARAGLGQDEALVEAVSARRESRVEALRGAGWHVERWVATTEWRIAIGLGDKANPLEIGLTLHGTYGWPTLPGTALKGMTRAFARRLPADERAMERVFGKAGGADAEKNLAIGGVRFFDALPHGAPAGIHLDVQTPHVKPYYDDAINGVPAARRCPPSEHLGPVILHFLSVSGSFAIDLASRNEGDARQASEWLQGALDDLGIGAKTTAGYGYLRLARRENVDWESQ
jgi:CRISPR type III-B/RAMP module RAMP protein Cmr6